MKKVLSGAIAALLLASSAIASGASAQSWNHRYDRQDRFVGNWCQSHRGDPSCRDWRNNHTRWDRKHYNRWYGDHRRSFGADDTAAAIFGFAAGAITGAISGAANGAASTSHQAACDARYKSYDWRSDSYMGYDGMRHRCTL